MSADTDTTFPTDGKVLVIGMTVPGRNAQLRFGARVYWKNYWEFVNGEPLPEGVRMVILPYAMKEDPSNRMKTWASRHNVPVEIEYTAELLQKRLAAMFGVDAPVAVKSNGNGNGKRTTATAPIAATKPAIVPTSTPPAPKPATIQVQPVERVHQDLNTGELWIKTCRIRPLKDQPRSYFDPKKMQELLTSIKARGQVTPIIVRVLDGDPDHDYELIEGERRLRTCAALGRDIRAVTEFVKNVEDQYERSFAANFAREGHTPLETGRAIKRMMEFESYRDLGKMARLGAIASNAGKTAIWAFNYLKLVEELSPEVQRMLEPDDDSKQVLPQSMGLFLCTIKSDEIQIAVCREVLEKNLSVAQAKHFARKLGQEAGVQVGSQERSPKDDHRILLTCLRRSLEGVEQILTMPHRTIDELFLNRQLADRNNVLQDIDKLTKLLADLRGQIDLKKTAK